MPRLLNLCLALAVSIPAVTVAQSAWAGELKLLAEAPETDGSGKLSGSPATTKELASDPGEEIWHLHLWAKLDKGAPGPLYAEISGKVPGSGKSYVVQNFEKSDYEGDKYISWSIELDGNTGFNRNRDYTIELVQLNSKGKNISLTSRGKFKLTYTEPAEEEDEGGQEDDGGQEDGDEQDAHDSLGGEGDEGDGGGDDGPPAVAPPAKKGCSVDPGRNGGSALVLLLLVGAAIRRRRD